MPFSSACLKTANALNLMLWRWLARDVHVYEKEGGCFWYVIVKAVNYVTYISGSSCKNIFKDEYNVYVSCLVLVNLSSGTSHMREL